MSDFTLRALLGHGLKSDEIIDLLVGDDVEVLYDFDRLHEGQADRYCAGAKSAGYQLCFDEHQTLQTIFCYIKKKEGFTAIDPELIGVPVYRTFDEAMGSVTAQGWPYVTPDAKKNPRLFRKWLRMQLADCSAHYQFTDGTLDLVTLMLVPP
jgi:hypothetical protein